jgi:hypothetical protein
MHNLKDFCSIQLCTGQDCLVFDTFEDAAQAGMAWDAELEEKFLKGDATDMTESFLDWDGDLVYQINPVFLSGGVTRHPAGTALHSTWATHPQAGKIKWGNLATQRHQ